MRWIHNPDLVVTLPEQITRDEVHPDEEANSLLITLVRCRNLPVMDTGGLWWLFRPVLYHRSRGRAGEKYGAKERFESGLGRKSFELPNADKDQKVVFEVLDYDAYGTSEIPLVDLRYPFWLYQIGS